MANTIKRNKQCFESIEIDTFSSLWENQGRLPGGSDISRQRREQCKYKEEPVKLWK